MVHQSETFGEAARWIRQAKPHLRTRVGALWDRIRPGPLALAILVLFPTMMTACTPAGASHSAGVTPAGSPSPVSQAATRAHGGSPNASPAAALPAARPSGSGTRVAGTAAASPVATAGPEAATPPGTRVGQAMPTPLLTISPTAVARAGPDASVQPASGLAIAPGSTNRDVTYCTPGGEPQKMDIYYPERGAGPQPAVLFVHGGAWTGGDKDRGEAPWARETLRHTYVFVSVNYRLAPKHRFPAQIEDVKCAVRFLRSHSGQLRIDPSRIGAIGASAGGHLVALLGTVPPSAGFDMGEYPDRSSSVRAVVDLFGPADLPAQMSSGRQLEQYQIGNVFGATSSRDPILLKYSPVTYVERGSPPFLLIHGERDDLVPLSQSQALQARLQAAGVPVKLVVVKNAGHGFTPAGGPISPTREEMGQIILGFFAENLR